MTRKLLWFALFAALFGWFGKDGQAQNPVQFQPTTTDPTGRACNSTQGNLKTPDGKLYTCQNGHMAQIGANGGGSPAGSAVTDAQCWGSVSTFGVCITPVFSGVVTGSGFISTGPDAFINFASNTTHVAASGDLWNNAGILQFGATPVNVVVTSGTPGAGICHFAGSTQTCTSSPVVSVDLNITTSTCSAPQVVTAISATGVATCATVPIPANSQSIAYTTVLADAGKQILHPTADNNARTFTIDSNANVAYPVGTVLTFINQINTVTISITSDTLQLAGTASTGSRTLAVGGLATAIKVTSTLWFISGPGLT